MIMDFHDNCKVYTRKLRKFINNRIKRCVLWNYHIDRLMSVPLAYRIKTGCSENTVVRGHVGYGGREFTRWTTETGAHHPKTLGRILHLLLSMG